MSTQVFTNSPITRDPSPFVKGLQITMPLNLPSYKLTVGAGSIVDSTGEYTINNIDPITLDVNVIGLNGIDAGQKYPNTLYQLFLIANKFNTSKSGLVASTRQGEPPILPVGYNIYAPIGYFAVDSAPGFITGCRWTAGSSGKRFCFYNGSISIGSTTKAAGYDFFQATNILPSINTNALLLATAVGNSPAEVDYVGHVSPYQANIIFPTISLYGVNYYRYMPVSSTQFWMPIVYPAGWAEGVGVYCGLVVPVFTVSVDILGYEYYI